MKFTPGLDGSKYRLRGYPDSQVRIYATDGEKAQPIHGAMKVYPDREWSHCAWRKDGIFGAVSGCNELDLIDREPEVVRVERWSFAYINSYGESRIEVDEFRESVERARQHRIENSRAVSAIQHHVYEVSK
jgi:hypothetical protein